MEFKYGKWVAIQSRLLILCLYLTQMNWPKLIVYGFHWVIYTSPPSYKFNSFVDHASFYFDVTSNRQPTDNRLHN